MVILLCLSAAARIYQSFAGAHVGCLFGVCHIKINCEISSRAIAIDVSVCVCVFAAACPDGKYARTPTPGLKLSSAVLAERFVSSAYFLRVRIMCVPCHVCNVARFAVCVFACMCVLVIANQLAGSAHVLSARPPAHVRF